MGDQVAVALNQFGNDNYKVLETLETENGRLREVNNQLTGCSESQSLLGNLKGCSSFLQPYDRLLKSRPGPDHKVAELQWMKARGLHRLPCQSQGPDRERVGTLRRGIGMSQWMSILTLQISCDAPVQKLLSPWLVLKPWPHHCCLHQSPDQIIVQPPWEEKALFQGEKAYLPKIL